MKFTKLTMILSALLLSMTTLAAKEKEIAVKLTVPDTSWSIAISEVYQVKNELWVISTLSQAKGMMGLMVISTLKASVKVTGPNLPIKHFIIGKTWNWKNKEPYTFIKDRKPIEKDLKSGKLLYREKKKAPQQS